MWWTFFEDRSWQTFSLEQACVQLAETELLIVWKGPCIPILSPVAWASSPLVKEGVVVPHQSIDCCCCSAWRGQGHLQRAWSVVSCSSGRRRLVLQSPIAKAPVPSREDARDSREYSLILRRRVNWSQDYLLGHLEQKAMCKAARDSNICSPNHLHQLKLLLRTSLLSTSEPGSLPLCLILLRRSVLEVAPWCLQGSSGAALTERELAPLLPVPVVAAARGPEAQLREQSTEYVW